MIRVTATLTMMALLMSLTAQAQTMVLMRGGSRGGGPAPAANFTGEVRVEMLPAALDPSNASAGSVTFAAGARTAWHSHPRGQLLIITAGTGRVQRWGQPSEEVGQGDVIKIPPGVKHWHGASPQAAMTHLAISEPQNGSVVQWMEQVSDEQYNASPASAQGTQRPSAPSPVSASAAQAVTQQPATSRPSGPVQQRLAPGLAALTDDVLFGDVWSRPQLSPRDRSLVTISVLIATGKSAQLAGHLGRALDNGVLPSEASGALAHLAIYAGWPSAVSALEIYNQVYTARNIDTSTLGATGTRLPAPASDAARARTVTEELGAVAPKYAQLTNDVVFGDLWRRPDLGIRDRSLVTIAALAAMGDDHQLDLYVRRAVESGLTRAQISEALTHLGFYAGWPKATNALTAVTKILGK